MDNTKKALLATVRSVVEELHPGQHLANKTALDSSLDRDLAFDSLGRMELFLRIERQFEVSFPESLFSTAETPRDLLAAIIGAEKSSKLDDGVAVAVEEGGEAVPAPDSVKTLIEALGWHARTHPNRLTIRFWADEGEGEVLTYKSLWEGAEAVAAGLQRRDLQHGEAVAIMLATGKEYFFSFLGILMAGGVPVPIYPPARPNQLEDHLNRHAAILDNCQAGILITLPEAKLISKLLKSRISVMRHVVTVEELSAASGKPSLPLLKSDDIAFLQYTSGSTGTPKGVTLTHANLLANLRAMGAAASVNPKDVFISWLPLYHDMGLIGAWLGSLYFAAPLVIMSPIAFLTRPQRWLRAVHKYGGTISAAPNFAYELCLRDFDANDFAGLDLSSWRFALNGAEGVSPATLERFCTTFAAFGFKREALSPVYGLAENSVGVAFPPMGRGARLDLIDRQVFVNDGLATPVEKRTEGAEVMTVVGCGLPIPWHQIRVVDDQDRELPERREGRLQFRGPSSTSGYFRNPEETAKLFCGDWLNTGDLAYIADGEMFITGRSKDLIIRAGRNIYPVELEEAVGDVEGIRKGNVAVFGAVDARSGTERLVVLAETRERDKEAQEKIRAEINRTSNDVIDTPPDDIALVAPGTVLKTSSGKIRRNDCRKLYESGNLAQRGRAVWLQAAVFALQSAIPQIRRNLREARAWGFAAHGWIMTALTALLLMTVVTLLPTLKLRWAAVRGILKTLAGVTGTSLTLTVDENFFKDTEARIYVANHSSYLDPFALIAALPEAVSFVAKGEIRQSPILHFALKRMGVEFVERFDRKRGIMDANRIALAARSGRTLLYFPEGTFTRMPGLLPFHMGAFLAAQESGVPVIPVAIRGTRSILRDGSWFPRNAPIRVIVGTPIKPERQENAESSMKWAQALSLRDNARRQLLHLSGEPDLAYERPPIFEQQEKG